MPKAPEPLIDHLHLAGRVIPITDLLTAPYEDVTEASLKLPVVLAFLGIQRAWAVERCWRAERDLDRAKARAYFDLKGGQFVAKGYGEKFTEEAIKRAVELEPDVDKAFEVYVDRKRRLDSFTETIAALKLKIDLIRSSETTRRKAAEEDL